MYIIYIFIYIFGIFLALDSSLEGPNFFYHLYVMGTDSFGLFFFMAVDVVSGCNGVRPYPLFYDLYVSLMKTTTFVIKMLTKYQLCETSELLRGGGCRFGEILVFQIKIRIVLLAFPLLTVCKYSQGIFFCELGCQL